MRSPTISNLRRSLLCRLQQHRELRKTRRRARLVGTSRWMRTPLRQTLQNRLRYVDHRTASDVVADCVARSIPSVMTRRAMFCTHTSDLYNSLATLALQVRLSSREDSGRLGEQVRVSSSCLLLTRSLRIVRDNRTGLRIERLVTYVLMSSGSISSLLIHLLRDVHRACSRCDP